MENLVNTLFIDSGRFEQGDNRSYYVKSLNKILRDGFIKVNICELGKYWTNGDFLDKNGVRRKFNIELKAYGYVFRCYYQEITAEVLLKAIARFISIPKISEMHTKSIDIHGLNTIECPKCHGKGIIKAFAHICQGICFECYGTKYVNKRYSFSI